MEKEKALLKNKKVIVAVILAILILIGSVYACVFALTPPDDKKDNNGGNIETVESEDEKDNTSDISSKPSTTDGDKDTESKPEDNSSKPIESKPEDTSSEKEPATSKPQDTSSEQKPVTSKPQDASSEQKPVNPTTDDVIIQGNNITFKSAKAVENLTDEQIIEYYTNYKFVIADYYSYKRLNIPYIEGEILGAISSISATSAEDAKRKIAEFGFLETANSYDITFLGEDKYFYEFRITFSYGEVTYIDRYLAYKEEAVHYSRSTSTGVYRKINMLDKDSVLNIIDLELKRRGPIIFRQLEETETEYIYNYYALHYVRGDFDMYDTVSLIKSFIKIDKKTGEYKFDTIYDQKVLKEVNIGEIN